MMSHRGGGRAVRAASRRLISGMVSGVMPGSAGGGCSGLTGGGAWVSVRSRSKSGGDGANRQGGHHEHGVADDRGVQPGLALVQPEAVLSELEILLHRPS